MKPASLTRRGDFSRVYSEGKRTRRNGVGISAYARGDSEVTRVGYSVNRSAGPAVTRNRIKRRLRAAVRTIELEPGFDVVISATAELARVDFQVLVEKVRTGLVGLGVAR